MYRNYKIVCVTPAGRRRYMQYLIPQIVACNIVDRYDIWVNTMNKEDIFFFQMLANQYAKIRLVYQPEGVINGNLSINAFWKLCDEIDAIYVRLDDDIVWIEPSFFEKIVNFRIEHPEYFLVAPLVINNALSTYILQVNDKIKLNTYYGASCTHPILWKSGDFAYQLHDWFIENYLKPLKYSELYCPSTPIGINRFSINSVCWFGRQMTQFASVKGDEEEYVSVLRPTQLGLSNCIVGDVLIAHFAFFPQRKALDKGNILNRYGDFLFSEWKNDIRLKLISDLVQKCMKYVEEHSLEVQDTNIPYIPLSDKKRSCITRIITRTGDIISRLKGKQYISK